MRPPDSPEKLLVTGGAGFIGTNLVRVLLDRGYRVTVFDNLSSSDGRYIRDLPLDLVRGDILDCAAVETAVRKADAVVHLAAQTGVPASVEDPIADFHTSVFGTLNLLEACRQTGREMRFVFASSNAPLGRQSPPATEEKAPLPISPYGAGKLAAEGYCMAYHGSWGLGTIALRFANVFGPYSSHKGSVVAMFFNNLMKSGKITVYGNGLQTRDFIHVSDLCRAIVLALENPVGGEVLQIATGVETSILYLARMSLEVSGIDGEVSHEEARRGDIYRNYSVIDKAKRVLGWSPEVELRQGLESTWEWYIGNR